MENDLDIHVSNQIQNLADCETGLNQYNQMTQHELILHLKVIDHHIGLTGHNHDYLYKSQKMFTHNFTDDSCTYECQWCQMHRFSCLGSRLLYGVT